MTTQMQNKREELKAISAHMQHAVKFGIYQTVNEGLVDMYKKQGHSEIHSFKKWMELGHVVKKGEKALLLWGEPGTAQNQEKKTDDDKDEFSFFPLAYVFSQLQVEPLITKYAAK